MSLLCACCGLDHATDYSVPFPGLDDGLEWPGVQASAILSPLPCVWNLRAHGCLFLFAIGCGGELATPRHLLRLCVGCLVVSACVSLSLV